MVDVRRNTTAHVPFVIGEVCTEWVYEIKFLGTYIAEDLPWPSNILVIVKKPQQLLYLLRIFTKNKLQRDRMMTMYHCIIESVLAHCITVWYAIFSAADKRDPRKGYRYCPENKRLLPTVPGGLFSFSLSP